MSGQENPDSHVACPATLAPLGSTLLPAVTRATAGRIGQLDLFRTDWQRGGALTAYGIWAESDGPARDVVVKLPVPPQELHWMQRLQCDETEAAVVPKLFAGDRNLNGYDMAWMVLERMPYGPLDESWDGQEVPLLLEAAARFYARGRELGDLPPVQPEPWAKRVRLSRQLLSSLHIPHRQRWSGALKRVRKALPEWLSIWEKRPTEDLCHGDLHMANAMTDAPPPGGPARLFDLARVHTGHWVEDAVYLESVFWARPERLGGEVVRKLSEARRACGLPTDARWPQLANIRRALLAASAPAQQATVPDPLHLAAALNVLESTLEQLPRP